jgi:hypothetical protein
MNIPRPADLPQIHFESWDRLCTYAARAGKELRRQLGWGYEGLVYATVLKTAIKAYRHINLYENERNVYFRLRDRQIKSVGRFAVPEFVGCDDELRVLEMSIVSPPFILDFAGAYLDKRPPFDAEQLAEWERDKMEQFEGRWREVRSALAHLQGCGIYLNDVKPGNVEFSADGE